MKKITALTIAAAFAATVLAAPASAAPAVETAQKPATFKSLGYSTDAIITPEAFTTVTLNSDGTATFVIDDLQSTFDSRYYRAVTWSKSAVTNGSVSGPADGLTSLAAPTYVSGGTYYKYATKRPASWYGLKSGDIVYGSTQVASDGRWYQAGSAVVQ